MFFEDGTTITYFHNGTEVHRNIRTYIQTTYMKTEPVLMQDPTLNAVNIIINSGTVSMPTVGHTVMMTKMTIRIPMILVTYPESFFQ
jgi:hypothetical protein